MAAHLNNFPNCLRIIAWNANSLIKRKDEFYELLRRKNIDVALVSETFLKEANKFKLHKYRVYRDDRVAHGGGTAIIIKNKIIHHRLNTPALDSLEATVIAIKMKSSTLKLVSVYKSPGKILDPTDVGKLVSSTLPTILAGDLNCKHSSWDSRTSNANGKRLFNYCNNKHIQVSSPGVPTYFSDCGHKPDVLDIALSRNLKSSIIVESLTELSSDHNPILIKYGDTILESAPPTRINTSKTDWDKFRNDLADAIPDVAPIVNTQEEVNDQFLNLNNEILTALTNNSPSPPKANNKSSFDLPPKIIRTIQAKNKIRSLWQKHRTPHIKQLLNKLSQDVREQLFQHRNKEWTTKLEALNTSDCSLWHMTKSLLRLPQPNPPLHGRNGMAYTDKAKSEAMADTLESTFQPNDDPSDIDHIELVEKGVGDFMADNTHSPIEDDARCTPKEVISLIQKLKNKKAPGMDNIPNVAIKNLPKKAVLLITNLYNIMIRNQFCVPTFKISKIVLFPKPGKDPAFPQNYRPISLLSGFSKLFERVLLKRLEDFSTSNNLLMDEQFGFRRKHSTTHQLVRVAEQISESFNSKYVTAGVFLDIAQAFDKVWHDGLIYKMISLKFPPYLIKIIRHYLTDRTFQAQIGSTMSGVRNIEAGVPQGSILGPFLFCIYINDMPKNIPGITYALYADDTALLCSSWNARHAFSRLQLALDELENWYTLWRIRINVTKSVAVLFTRQVTHKKTNHESLTLFDDEIPEAKSAKYLGVTLDHRLTWTKHVQEVANKANQRLGMLYPLIRSRNGLSMLNCTIIYKSIIRPIMTYAVPVWASAATSNIKKLETLQNRSLRIASRSPWYVTNKLIQTNLKIPPLRQFMTDLITKFYQSNIDHENPLVKSITLPPDPGIGKYKRPREALHWLAQT